MSKLKLSSNASGSGNVTLQSPNTNSDFTVTVPTGTGALPLMKLETAVASTSGTSIDFTGIPSWVKRITVMFSGVSTSGTSPYLIQLGAAGGIETSGYVGQGSNENGDTSTTLSSGFFAVVRPVSAATSWTGMASLALISGSTYVCTSSIGASAAGTNAGQYCQGNKTLSDTLDRVRITTVNGTDTFDAGSINIMYEG